MSTSSDETIEQRIARMCRHLGLQLTPWQQDVVKRVFDPQWRIAYVSMPKRSGRATVVRIVQALALEAADSGGLQVEPWIGQDVWQRAVAPRVVDGEWWETSREEWAERLYGGSGPVDIRPMAGARPGHATGEDRGMSDLVEFLAARLDEDEASALSCAERHWRPDGVSSCQVYVARNDGSHRTIAWCSNGYDDDFGNSLHIARWDPARVLAEVEAKRQILQIHGRGTDPCDAHDAAFETIECDTVRLLTQLYDRHPDYREEWRP